MTVSISQVRNLGLGKCTSLARVHQITTRSECLCRVSSCGGSRVIIIQEETGTWSQVCGQSCPLSTSPDLVTLRCAHTSPRDVVKTQILSPWTQRGDLSFAFANTFPAEADVTGHEAGLSSGLYSAPRSSIPSLHLVLWTLVPVLLPLWLPTSVLFSAR